MVTLPVDGFSLRSGTGCHHGLARQVHWHALPENRQTLPYQYFLAQRRHLMLLSSRFCLMVESSSQKAHASWPNFGQTWWET